MGEGTGRSDPLDELRDAKLMRAFRQALARRGADASLRLYRVEYPTTLLCARCFEDAARSLGGDVYRCQPWEGEEALFEAYGELHWYFDSVETRDGPLEDYHPSEEPPLEGMDARFSEVSAYGLVRLTFPNSTAWVWSYHLSREGIEACVAVKERHDLRPFLRAAKRLHVDHERRRSSLTLIGGKRSKRVSLSPLTWDDVVLPEALRDDLQHTVAEFFAARDLYRRHKVPHRRGVLLAGPPGNGKTSILRAIGASCGVPVVVTVVDEGGHNLARAFQTAADLAPSILCLEDLDSLVGEGSGRTQFLNLLDGLKPLDGVLVIATTNHPEQIDPAITKRPSRFDRVFVIPEPGLDQRTRYLSKELGDDAPSGAVSRCAEATQGYSVAFLKELVLQARLAAVRRGDARLSDADLDGALALTQDHLSLASNGLANRGELGFGPRVASDPC